MDNLTIALAVALIGTLSSVLASIFTKLFADKAAFPRTKIKVGKTEIEISQSSEETIRRILDGVRELQEYPQVFISYSHRDREFVDNLAKDLRASGIKVWLADEQIKVGDSITEKIRTGIAESQWVIVVLSQDLESSEYLNKELQLALNEEKKRERPFILPVLVQDIKLPMQLEDRQFADFRQDYQLGLEKLLARIKLQKRPNHAFTRPAFGGR